MTLSPATSVGFAVVGGVPADARQWITVDMAGFPGIGRRGYVVATEPLDRSWSGIELAVQAREIIVTELRRLQHLPADEALGRSLAAANAVVFGKTHESAITRLEDAPLIGVTAIVFEDQFATFAHLPPGQLLMVEDGLIYALPDFESWFPNYEQPDVATNAAEPLGYASWTAPLMAQTEIRAGDAIILCASETGRAFIEDVFGSGHTIRDLSYLHHRDPDIVLDTFKNVVIHREMTTAAVAVISFPPLPNSSQIQTIADVRQRARDYWRHGKAVIRQLKPAAVPQRRQTPPPQKADVQAMAATSMVAIASTAGATAVRKHRGKARIREFFEPAPDKKAAWRKPSQISEFGVPGAHGVDLFRGQTHYMGDARWRHNLPRLPVIGSAWIWPLLVMIIAGLVLGGLWVRQEYLRPDVDTDAIMAEIDQRIVTAQDADDEAEVAAELAVAQNEIDRARELGVPAETLDQRQQVVTEMLDDATAVVRMSDVQRIGTLPEEFGDASVQGVYTPAGVFFVAGSLYQYRPNQEGTTADLVTILTQGEEIRGSTVGSLWGLAFDAKGLYVTDGETVFMLPVESQEWRAVKLGRINNQEWTPGPIAAFDGSIYLLQAQYRQIYRFPIETSETVAEPRDWLLTGARDDIERATDLAIDGNIYVLLEDGTVQQMYQGDLKSEIMPEYVDPDIAEALVGRGGAGYLYQAVAVEVGDEGRIVAFDLEGNNAAQLKLPIGFTTGDANVREPFDGIQDVIVDESTGTIYIINADAIWTARYSLPELPEEETSPEEDVVATPAA